MNAFEIELRKLGPDYDPEVLIGIDPGMKVLGTAVSVGSLSRHLAQNHGRSPRRRKRRNQHRHPKTRGEQILQPHQNHCRLHPDITELHSYRQPEQAIIQISNGIYRHMCKLNHYHFWHESLMKREPWYAGVLRAMPSFKTANYYRYFQQLEFVWKHSRFLIAFQDEASFVRWCFTRLRMKEMALDALVKQVVPVPSPAVCIALGDWSREDGIRGHANMLIKGLAKALKKRATVLPMDEFRTSQLCSSCHMRLKQARLLTKVRRKEDEVDVRLKENPSKKELKEIEEMSRWKKTRLKDFKAVLRCDRNVLRCTNSSCKARLWNRDVNAARNMLYLLKRGLQGEHGPRRPLPFRRGK